MNVTSKVTNERSFFSHLDEKEVSRILAEAVAAQVGINLGSPRTSYRVVISSRDSSTGIERYAEVRITQNLQEVEA